MNCQALLLCFHFIPLLILKEVWLFPKVTASTQPSQMVHVFFSIPFTSLTGSRGEVFSSFHFQAISLPFFSKTPALLKCRPSDSANYHPFLWYTSPTSKYLPFVLSLEMLAPYSQSFCPTISPVISISTSGYIQSLGPTIPWSHFYNLLFPISPAQPHNSNGQTHSLDVITNNYHLHNFKFNSSPLLHNLHLKFIDAITLIVHLSFHIFTFHTTQLNPRFYHYILCHV